MLSYNPKNTPTVGRRVARELTHSEWLTIQGLARSSGLLEQPLKVVNPVVLDGSEWLLEARLQGKYHVMRVLTPKPGPFLDAGLAFVSLAGLAPPEAETY